MLWRLHSQVWALSGLRLIYTVELWQLLGCLAQFAWHFRSYAAEPWLCSFGSAIQLEHEADLCLSAGDVQTWAWDSLTLRQVHS